jgi:hypothetical protein
MTQVSTIGLDLAKTVPGAWGRCERCGNGPPGAAPGPGAGVVRQAAACLVGMEACATAHY